MSSKKKSTRDHKGSNDTSTKNLHYTVQLTKQAYEERAQPCSYKDYLALITLATFHEHELRHIPVGQGERSVRNAVHRSRETSFPPQPNSRWNC